MLIQIDIKLQPKKRMIKKIFLFIIIILKTLNICFSQPNIKSNYILKGKIVDSLFNPIMYAVIIIEDTNKSILAFTYSDSLGNYKIVCNKKVDNFIINVRRVGYKSAIYKVNSNIVNFDIFLKPSLESNLNEVIVKSHKVIEESNDTIFYNIQKFKDGSEQNVEDVLAKLPGVTVDKGTGKIKYQGKEIKKILLDGDDLTDNNYQVLSKNLSANWLDGVEIIKKFNDKRLLKGILQTEDIAINLKIKESVKSPIFGQSNFGLGIKSKYSIKTELLSYLNKLKLFSNIETNNTGNDLESYNLDVFKDIQLSNNQIISTENIFKNELLPPNYFKQENFNFQKGYFISNSMIIKPTDKFFIRSTTSFYKNEINYNFTNTYNYFSTNSVLNIYQTQSQIQNPQNFFQDLKIVYQISDNQDLNLKIKYKNINTNFYDNIITNFSKVLQTQFINQNIFYSTLNYTNKITKKWVIETDIFYSKDFLNENLKFDSNDKNTYNLSNKIIQDNINNGFNINLNGKINNQLLVKYSVNFIKSNLTYYIDLFSKTNNLNIENLNTEFEIKKNIKNIELYSNFKIKNMDLLYNNENTNQTLLEPFFAISYKKFIFNKFDFKIKTLYSLEYQFLKPTQLFIDTLFSSFRNKEIYNVDFKIPTKSHLIIFSQKISDNNTTFINSNFEIGLEYSNNSIVPNINYIQNVIITNYYQTKNTERFFLNFLIGKYFPKIKTNISFLYDNNVINSNLIINNNYGVSIINKSSININAGILLSKKINLSTSFNHFYSSNIWMQNLFKFSYQKYFFNLLYNKSLQLKLNANIQLIQFKESQGGISSISGANIIYTSKNNKWLYEFSIANIFNNMNIKLTNSELFFSTNSIYPIQPRFFLLKCMFQF